MANSIVNLKLSAVKVLLVEDLIPMQALMRDLLLTMGIGTVNVAHDGKEGYDVYCNDTPDIIVTDWYMPYMDGIELVRKIRTEPTSPNRTVPIIMTTGFCSKDQIALARDAGITEFLAKPFSSQDIAKRIAHIIRNPRDLVITSQFVGPDRRRKKKDGKGEDTRRGQEPKKIPANTTLQQKAGVGDVDPKAVENSQKIIDNNKIDFVPIARKFLEDLDEAVEIVRKGNEPARKSIDRLSTPIMQIKANGILFNYGLVGNLAKTALDFLNSLTEMNEFVLEVITALQNTLTHLLDKHMSGDGDEIGESLQDELEAACARYMRTRADLLKEKLKETVEKKEGGA